MAMHYIVILVEASTGIEPVYTDLQFLHCSYNIEDKGKNFSGGSCVQKSVHIQG